jgi:hypothetical protein
MTTPTPAPWTFEVGESSTMIHSPEGYIAEFSCDDHAANAELVCKLRHIEWEPLHNIGNYEDGQQVLFLFDKTIAVSYFQAGFEDDYTDNLFNDSRGAWVHDEFEGKRRTFVGYAKALLPTSTLLGVAR